MSWTTLDSVSAALPVTEARRPMSSSVHEVDDSGSGAGWLTMGSLLCRPVHSGPAAAAFPSKKRALAGAGRERPLREPAEAFCRGFRSIGAEISCPASTAHDQTFAS